MSIPSTSTYPAGGTWFDTLRESFVDVPIGADNAIPTTEFLEASESLTTLFGTPHPSSSHLHQMCLETNPINRCPGLYGIHTR